VLLGLPGAVAFAMGRPRCTEWLSGFVRCWPGGDGGGRRRVGGRGAVCGRGRRSKGLVLAA